MLPSVLLPAERQRRTGEADGNCAALEHASRVYVAHKKSAGRAYLDTGTVYKLPRTQGVNTTCATAQTKLVRSA